MVRVYTLLHQVIQNYILMVMALLILSQVQEEWITYLSNYCHDIRKAVMVPIGEGERDGHCHIKIGILSVKDTTMSMWITVAEMQRLQTMSGIQVNSYYNMKAMEYTLQENMEKKE